MYHLVVKNVGRRARLWSAVRAAAYRSGECLVDEETGEVYDYRDKEVYHKEIINSEPEAFWAEDRGSLWNTVHIANPRRNAVFAKEIELALPAGLDHKTKIALTREFVREEVVEKYGVVADLGFHHFEGQGSHNPHCHILFTIRKVEAEGFGERVKKLATRKFVFDIRKKWRIRANHYLSKAGLPLLDERSCLRQGRERNSVHMGERAWKMLQRDVETIPSRENRKYAERRRERERERVR